MNKEELWRTRKYEVLAKDEKAYREIQQLIQESSFEVVNQSIQKAIQIKPTIGSVTNSYEHMWGYFKKKATSEEKKKTFDLLTAYQQGERNEQDLWDWLRQLAVRYQVNYLLESTLLQLNIENRF